MVLADGLRIPLTTVSAYVHASPTIAHGDKRELVPLPWWLGASAADNARAGVDGAKRGFPQVSGIETRSISCEHPGRLGCSSYIPANSSRTLDGTIGPCNTSLALDRLRRLDLVCDLANISRLCLRIGARTASRPAKLRRVHVTRRTNAKGQVPPGQPIELAPPPRASDWLDRLQQPGVHGALREAAWCDQQLHSKLEQVGMTLKNGCWEGATAGRKSP